MSTLYRPMTALRRRVRRALTLIELMVVVALVGVIVLLAAPNMSEMIGMQRLRAINDQLANDIQYMRGEAISRNQFVGFTTRNQVGEPVSCYVIFINAASGQALNPFALDAGQCNCSNAVGSACSAPHRELRSVQIPRDMSIDLRVHADQSTRLVLSPITGGRKLLDIDSSTSYSVEFCVEVRRSPRGRLRTAVGASGRTTVCSPDGSVPGVATCPAYSTADRNCHLL